MQDHESENKDFTMNFRTTCSAEVFEDEIKNGITVAITMEVILESNYIGIIGSEEMIKKTVADKLWHLAIDERAKIEELREGAVKTIWHEHCTAVEALKYWFNIILKLVMINPSNVTC